MQKIHSVNSITLPFSAEAIWEVLTDISSYSLWWPSTLKTKVLNVTQELIGSQIEVRPYGGLPFICAFAASVDHLELTMQYSGIYSGTGIWKLSETNGRTKVDYEINLDINNRFIRLLSYVMPVDKVHYKLMDEVLFGLKNRLESLSSPH